MSTAVTLPLLGESVTEGTVSRWLKRVGDPVAEGEPIVEVSTDKVDAQIPSPATGVILEIRAHEDQVVSVGTILAVVGDPVSMSSRSPFEPSDFSVFGAHPSGFEGPSATQTAEPVTLSSLRIPLADPAPPRPASPPGLSLPAPPAGKFAPGSPVPAGQDSRPIAPLTPLPSGPTPRATGGTLAGSNAPVMPSPSPVGLPSAWTNPNQGSQRGNSNHSHTDDKRPSGPAPAVAPSPSPGPLVMPDFHQVATHASGLPTPPGPVGVSVPTSPVSPLSSSVSSNLSHGGTPRADAPSPYTAGTGAAPWGGTVADTVTLPWTPQVSPTPALLTPPPPPAPPLSEPVPPAPVPPTQPAQAPSAPDMFVADPIPEIVMEPSLTQPLTSFAASDVPTAPSASDQPGVTLETPTATQATATVAAEDFPPTFPGPTPESQGASTTPDTRFVPVPLKPPKAVPPVASGPYITPLVRKLAKESGVDLDTIQGTGVGGRIRKKDVEAAARELPPRTDKDTADDGVLSTDKGEETKDFVEEISEQEETTESTQESAPKETAEAAETKEDLSAQEETVVVEDTMKPEKVEDTAEDTKKPEKSKETTDTVVDTSDQTQSDQSAEPESAAEETAQPTKDADDVPDMIDDGIAPVSRPDTPEEVEQGETPDDSTTPSAEPTEPIPTQPDQPDKPAAEPDQTTQVVPETDSVPDAAQPAKADQTSESGDLVEPVDLTDPQVFPPPSAVALATTSGRIEPLTPSRTASVASGPVQLTSVVEADVTAIARLRTSASAAFLARHGFELTYIPFVAKAILEALRLFPMFNATIDSNAGTVTYASAEHLTLPMSTPQGLAFPVIRDAGDLSVAGLASRIHDLATRASAGQIAENDLVGGTFSLVDHSRSGTLMDTPVIITPQVGIASVGSVVKRPVVVDDPRLGEIVAVRDMVYLSLSYDHRVIGTSDAAQFLGTIKTRLEVGDFGAEF